MGEAMDRSDKSTNKAMSAAFKYACFQTFCIPTEEMIDSEEESLEIGEKKTEYITEKQYNELKALIAQAKLQEASVAKQCKVESLMVLPATQYDNTVRKLNKNIADLDKQEKPA